MTKSPFIQYMESKLNWLIVIIQLIFLVFLCPKVTPIELLLLSMFFCFYLLKFFFLNYFKIFFLIFRNKTNATSMVGQITSWIMEIWYIILVGVLSTMFQVDLLREVSVLIKTSEYFLIPLVQILTSAPIKRFIKQ